MMPHPHIPVRPPASGLFLRLCKPALRIALDVVVEPVAAFVAGGRINHAGNMAARGEDKSRISADQVLRAKRRLPWHDVVLTGCEQIDRYRYIRKVKRYHARRRLTGIPYIVFQISIARLPTLHRSGQADAIGIPE